MWAICSFIGPNSSAFGEEKRKSLPARGFSVSPEYTGIILYQGDSANIDLILTNEGRSDEDIDLMLTSIPAGWKAWIKTYDFAVSGAHVKSDNTKTLTLRIELGNDSKPGQYTLSITARSKDRHLSSKSKIAVAVKEKKEKKKPGGIHIVTSYPVLRGPTDAKFEFSLEVENKVDKDSILNLSAQGPENWDINFKPAYEDKYISSLRIKANQNQTVAVEVKPNPWAEPGEYPIKVNISSPEAKGEAELIVTLTGTYKLDTGTRDGLLSLNALRGKGANISFYVQNNGSAPLNDVKLLSFKPENWKVEFNPENIEVLAPQELKQVEAIITPDEQALVGDYSVGLRIESGKISKTIELRVTANASSAWGFLGLGIILLVVVCLVVLFIRLGRR
jgi:uncharacterized membrane protein